MRTKAFMSLAALLLLVGAGCGQPSDQAENRPAATVESQSELDLQVEGIEADVSAEDSVSAEEAGDADEATSDQDEIKAYGNTNYEVQ